MPNPPWKEYDGLNILKIARKSACHGLQTDSRTFLCLPSNQKKLSVYLSFRRGSVRMYSSLFFNYYYFTVRLTSQLMFIINVL